MSGETRYWIVNLTGEETGGQVLIRQVGGKNPEVLAFDTVLLPVTSNVVPADIAVQLNKSNETGVQQGPAGQQLPAGANHGPPMLAAARAANRKLDTSTVPNTNGGTLACAWAVNEIARRAVGKPIGGGLSTVGLFDALQRGHQSASEAQLEGGCIVISPTQPGRTGHVGIVGEVAANVSATKIYSNSSSKRLFCDNYTIASWKSYFQGRGLPVLFFKLVG